MVAIAIEQTPQTQEITNNTRLEDRDSLRSVLATVPLFATLDTATLERMSAFAFRRTFTAGERIVEEGRTANGLFVVVHGRVDIVKGIDGPTPDVVATLGDGEPIGEMEILAGWPRTASAIACEETEAVGMDSWVFLDYLREEPRLAMRLLQIMAKRLAETSAKLAED